MNASEYLKRIISLRNLRSSSQVIAEDRILEILKRAANDLTILMTSANVESFTYTNYAARRAEIVKLIQQMTMDINFAIRISIRGASDRIASAYAKIASSFADSKGYSFDFQAAFATVPTMALRNVTNRLWTDGFNFSDRVWQMNDYTKNSVNDIISAGVARGESAVNLSKDLRSFLLDPTLKPGTTWTTAIKPSVSGRGTINYNALRLARTELNNAYRETLVLSNEVNPVTLGLHYNTSSSHGTSDICDVWENIDQWGMGPGNYPAGKAPIDHPNGLCYYTEIIRPVNQWDNEKPTFTMNTVLENKVLSFVGKDALPSLKSATYKAYNSMNNLLAQNKRSFKRAA
jgi:hypothetical protein